MRIVDFTVESTHKECVDANGYWALLSSPLVEKTFRADLTAAEYASIKQGDHIQVNVLFNRGGRCFNNRFVCSTVSAGRSPKQRDRDGSFPTV